MRVIDQLAKLGKTIRDCEHTLQIFSKTPFKVPAEEVERVTTLKTDAERDRDHIESLLAQKTASKVSC